MNLSKSKYTRGLQCHKSLWLYQHRYDLRTPPDALAQTRMDAGTAVGELAQALFPGGKEIVFEPDNFPRMLGLTKLYLEQGIQTIYEASISRDGVFVACDILHHGKQGWELYEVKSSTRVKEYHRNDIAIQWHVLNKAGLKPVKAALVHINTSYRRSGELDIQQLFKIVDVTEDTISRQTAIPDNLLAMKEMLKGDEPDIEIGLQCNNPFECDFMDYCWSTVPAHSVFNLYNLKGHRKFELYNSGVVNLDDLPGDFPLNAVQKLQVAAHKAGAPVVNKAVIRDFLDKVVGPIYYLDFETFQNAVPRFDGQRPYEQVPFQYSLHIEQGGTLKHLEYLANENIDPRRELAERLLLDMGNEGTIVAFNMAFEKRVINKLASLFPDLSPGLTALNERFIDLVVPFRQGGYYDEKMNGSFSIKAILPALFPDDPELSYKNLSIQDGNTASEIFANLYQNSNVEEVKVIRRGLLDYCRLDTLAMVKIVNFLKSLSG